ncbi:stalk domain-containing protein [Ferviditalea candida]|uniref:Stalk domain-containing protein n=1 Tax=Ferviditalea candida TaxID=3108399 RepID=A0ABU5ZFA4_9BACL|nr:stalk domain-containing protein [Paenibacillaceae bacterium T2]
MKNVWKSAAIVALSVSLFAAPGLSGMQSAFAKDQGDRQVKEHASKAEEPQMASESGDDSVTGDTYGDGHGHKGYTGLLKALENVQDKPAGEVIANLLQSKYGFEDVLGTIKVKADALAQEIQAGTASTADIEAKKEELKAYAEKLREQLKNQLESLKEKDTALSNLADIYAASGSDTEAADVEKEAIKQNVKNLESYSKLAKLYEKMGKKGIHAFVNGEEPQFDVPPVIKDGRTLVPFRAISKALHADVTWDAQEKSVTVTKEGITVKLIIGSKTAYVNGQEVQLDVPAQTLDNRTVVPIAFVSQAFDAVVKWIAETKTVVIYDQTAANASTSTGTAAADTTTTTTDTTTTTTDTTTTTTDTTTTTNTTTNTTGTTATGASN